MEQILQNILYVVGIIAIAIGGGCLLFLTLFWSDRKRDGEG